MPQGGFIPPEEGKRKGPPPGLGRVGRHDHAMDEIRYFAATVAAKGQLAGGIYAGTVERERF